mmetsp:Transcript_12024/g.18109  ORF Transcript_12024/g.18109 Transcript_12024/m.18109 type:complete len:96 (+) Transcript_12024:1266-1553(+)
MVTLEDKHCFTMGIQIGSLTEAPRISSSFQTSKEVGIIVDSSVSGPLRRSRLRSPVVPVLTKTIYFIHAMIPDVCAGYAGVEKNVKVGGTFLLFC